MRIVKYICSMLLLMLGVSQAVPIYLISSGLLQHQGSDDTGYFAGKLAVHVVIAIIFAVLALKLFNSARKHKVSGGGSV